MKQINKNGDIDLDILTYLKQLPNQHLLQLRGSL